MNIYNLTDIRNVFFFSTNTFNNDNDNSLFSKISEGMSAGISVPVHPKEIERRQRIEKRMTGRITHPQRSYHTKGSGLYDNSVIFVSGNIGFGTRNDAFFKDILDKLSAVPSKQGYIKELIRRDLENSH